MGNYPRNFAYNNPNSGRNIVTGDCMNSTLLTACIVLIVAASSQTASSSSESTCPVTLGSDKVFAKPWPQASSWYGSESLATILPEDGIWSTTKPGARISVKVFWWSIGFETGMESDLSVKVESLDGSPASARIDRPANAYAGSMGAPTMLTGIDFPDPGCWRISAEYSGQKLTFIVETIDVDEYRKRYH